MSADIVTDWNATLSKAIHYNVPASPGVTPVSSVSNEKHGIKAAISSAAKTLLDFFYASKPGALEIIQADYTARINLVPDGADKTNGINLGSQIASAYLALRAADGSTSNASYTAAAAPGVWRLTPPNNAPALLPGWGDVTPFGIVSSDQFLPYITTDLTSEPYATEFTLTKEIGSLNSTTRTAEQSARLHALVGMSVGDVAIACWKCKYATNFWRPIMAIREADTDGNSKTERDAEWQPFLATPPFPEYTSGHSTFSRASATILKNFFGTDNITFTTNSDFTPPLPNRTYTSFNAAAAESGMSRIYGGIHFLSANFTGQMNGHLIAKHNFAYYLQPKSALQFAFIKNGNGALTMQAQVDPSASYQVQTSTDLVSWTSTTIMSSATGLLTIIDSVPANTPRFYRLNPINSNPGN